MLIAGCSSAHDRDAAVAVDAARDAGGWTRASMRGWMRGSTRASTPTPQRSFPSAMGTFGVSRPSADRSRATAAVASTGRGSAAAGGRVAIATRGCASATGVRLASSGCSAAGRTTPGWRSLTAWVPIRTRECARVIRRPDVGARAGLGSRLRPRTWFPRRHWFPGTRFPSSRRRWPTARNVGWPTAYKSPYRARKPIRRELSSGVKTKAIPAY